MVETTIPGTFSRLETLSGYREQVLVQEERMQVASLPAAALPPVGTDLSDEGVVARVFARATF